LDGEITDIRMRRNSADSTFIISTIAVALSGFALPFVTGYGTVLFQAVVLGGWALLAKTTSGRFADQNHGVLWPLVFSLNLFVFVLPAAAMWLPLRRRLPGVAAVLLTCWALLYVAMLFVLFPATDGP
jgi:NhaP-type Na+/H+ or K+/H+ antiporter